MSYNLPQKLSAILSLFEAPAVLFRLASELKAEIFSAVSKKLSAFSMHMLCRTQQAKTDLAMNSKSGDGNF
jgi:hypothetical protein